MALDCGLFAKVGRELLLKRLEVFEWCIVTDMVVPGIRRRMGAVMLLWNW